jgi:hypothetical protein
LDYIHSPVDETFEQSYQNIQIQSNGSNNNNDNVNDIESAIYYPKQNQERDAPDLADHGCLPAA